MELMVKVERALVLGRETTSRPLLATEFGVTENTVRRYEKRVRDRWASEEVELRPQRRMEFRAAIRENLELAWQTGNAIAGAATLRIWAKLDGLEAPEQIQIHHLVDVRAMSPMERRSEIERLLRKRAEALDGTRAQPMALIPAATGGNGKDPTTHC